MVWNIFRAGPSLILSKLTMSFCVRRRNASPSISWKNKTQKKKLLLPNCNELTLKLSNVAAAVASLGLLLMKISPGNQWEKLTSSPNTFAWSTHPKDFTWLMTSSMVHFMIRCRSLEATPSFSELMAALSSLRPIIENWLPSGQGNAKGVTCWTALSASEKPTTSHSLKQLTDF